MTPLLIVEDDRNIGDGLVQYLGAQGFAITLARSLAEARADLGTAAPALIVLDWMLPDGQGLDLLQEVRASGNRTPVIFLTARGELVDRVVGLEAGAADYVVKPFEPRELVARIRAQLRATAGPAPSSVLEVGGVSLDTAACTVHAAGAPVTLSPKELLLLRLLMENPNRVLSREEILNRVWGYDRAPTTRTVDTHVLQLRGKLPDLAIETVRGLGYRLRIAVVLFALFTGTLLAGTGWLADSPAPPDVTAAHAAFASGDPATALARAQEALAAHAAEPLLEANLLTLVDAVLAGTPDVAVGWTLPRPLRTLSVAVDRERSPGRLDRRRLKVILGLGAGEATVTGVRLSRGSRVALNPFAAHGNAGLHRSPLFGTFHWSSRRLDMDELLIGLHALRVRLSDGTRLDAQLPLARLDSSAAPLVRSPRPGETLSSPNPTIQFDDFRSPEWNPAEKRELIATVARDDELAFEDPERGDEVWSLLIENPSVTRLTIGPQAGVEPPTFSGLAPGRYALQLTYREQRAYGPATLSRDSTTRIPFRIAPR